MAKYEARLIARKLRKESTLSIDQIAKKLDVSKSSVSLWCRDIMLSQEQMERLKKQKGSFWGRVLGTESNRKKKRDAINLANTYGEKKIKNISKRDLLLIATSLYWSEGSKTDTTSSWMFVNSDPEMILLMKKFLVSVINIDHDDIVCGIQINQIHKIRIETVLNFWKNLLELKDDQIRKPYFIKTNSQKIYENYNDYFGVCRLFVRKSKNLKYKMLGLIKAMKSNILSA